MYNLKFSDKSSSKENHCAPRKTLVVPLLSIVLKYSQINQTLSLYLGSELSKVGGWEKVVFFFSKQSCLLCLQHKCKIKDWFPPIFDKTKSFNFKATMIRKMNMVFGWINFVNSKLGLCLKTIQWKN